MNKLNHIAFIMDGNGRWGKIKKKGRNYGHLQGVKTVQKVVTHSIKLKIPIISFYVFSTENWKRPKKEINYLFKLINFYFKKELDNIIKNKIKINIIGNINSLPSNIKENLKEVIDKTANNKKLIINLAINYGSKTEIVEAFKKIKKKKEAISIKNIEKNLYTTVPNPDILIRTGGKKRLSNFLLWQLAYSEFYFLDKLWPDFSKKDLINIIANFKKIKRNFGNI
ncbi:MAG: polyprenyl diphosphate synthase [Pelagibacteraceae bacterium]|jgi:undecaprenyl diphosphate synthase